MIEWSEEAVYVCPCKIYMVLEADDDIWLAVNAHDPDIHAHFDTEEEAKAWVEANHECI